MKEYIYYLEILAALVATVTYRSYKFTSCKYFLPYLWFVVFVESFGQISKIYYDPGYNGLFEFLRTFMNEKYLDRNIWLMNIYDIVNYNFYLLFFYKIINGKRLKKWILLFIFLLWVTITVNLIDNDMDLNSWYLNYVMLVGASFIFICSVLYFLQIIREDMIFEVYRRLTFWLVIGMLFFQLACTPIFLFSKQLNFSAPVYNVILSISNYVLYGCFIIGFVINAYEHYRIKKNARG